MATSGDYFALDKAAGLVYDRLAESDDPHTRAQLLREAAALERQMAGLHGQVFGADPNRDEDGRDVAESIAHSALLLRLLADVEHSVADNGRRHETGTWLEPYAGRVLDRMAATSQPYDRAMLLKDLYEAVEPVVGGQAAETLACVPLGPGLRGWDGGRYLPNSFPKMLRTVWRAWRDSRAA